MPYYLQLNQQYAEGISPAQDDSILVPAVQALVSQGDRLTAWHAVY
jgi:hypothetical protein